MRVATHDAADHHQNACILGVLHQTAERLGPRAVLDPPGKSETQSVPQLCCGFQWVSARRRLPTSATGAKA